ncbi:uncharacterized protein LOC105430170 [Pogonomyrmex barbatus]|uniref:Uncharacterized protein LOC105430170 n=1 Tax=Pogonomyrmex barbatus TaxID=144034 RepID=A0A6I9WGJ3_9HYME|nr:uncharacterized protein LOC105430170 [Pogonomyrmex barbatus]
MAVRGVVVVRRSPPAGYNREVHHPSMSSRQDTAKCVVAVPIFSDTHLGILLILVSSRVPRSERRRSLFADSESTRACLIATRVSASRTRAPRAVYFGATAESRPRLSPPSRPPSSCPELDRQSVKLLRRDDVFSAEDDRRHETEEARVTPRGPGTLPSETPRKPVSALDFSPHAYAYARTREQFN